jgi:hypothetical protein
VSSCSSTMTSIERPALLAEVLGAAVVLPVLVVVDAHLRLLGLDRTRRAMARLVPPKTRQGAADVARDPDTVRVVRAVDHAGLAYRKNGRCLRRSVLLWAWLRRQGLAADIVLGVRRTAGGLTGHAWVTYAGEPLFESTEVIAGNVSFGAFEGPAAP